jgi:hypothetical protein
MGRLNLESPIKSLDELVPQYCEDKSKLDALKKVVDSENAILKEQLYNSGTDTYSAGGYTVKRTVSNRESLNEAKLMEVLRKHKIEGIIKTKEYVDLDELETYLYHNEPTDEFATDLANCKTVTEVIQLRISKAKKTEE